MNNDPKRELLRHMVATVAFRGHVAIDGAPDEFAEFRASSDSRSAVEILSHIGDLLIGSAYLMSGEYVELSSSPLPWRDQIARFDNAIRQLDDVLSSDARLAYPVENFVQGPVGDALTHVGQIVLLRRLSGNPIDPAPYFTAVIAPGSSGEEIET